MSSMSSTWPRRRLPSPPTDRSAPPRHRPKRRRPIAAAPSGCLRISVGKEEGVRPADLVGAIAGEAGISSSLIGAIKIHDDYSLAEIPEEVADQVIMALKTDEDPGSQGHRSVQAGAAETGELNLSRRPPRLISTEGISTVDIIDGHEPGTRPDSLLPLPPAVFHILMALADEDRHGYGIIQEVLSRTNGEVRLSPGTLYRSIQRMLDDDADRRDQRAARAGARR